MLDNVKVLHRSPELHQPRIEPPIEVRPVQIVKAVSLAHRKAGKFEAARGAAAWVDGRALLDPTIELASEVFDVSYPLIADARVQLGLRPFSRPLGLLALGWSKASPAEKDAFTRANLTAIWVAIERVTA
jgi:hypothetical protein